MKRLTSYITEKLHLKDGMTSSAMPSKKDITQFVVIYSDKSGKISMDIFDDYDDAVSFTKNEYYLDGYCLTDDDHDFITSKLMKDSINYEATAYSIVDYAKEHDLVKIFDYEDLI